ncbi:MAG: Iron-dependent repressor IdeR [Anaerolineales bacterium]|nr:Iron-dependent repressor IdeR [Anaerolineales bacterium]
MPDPLFSLLTAVSIAALGSLLFWPERGVIHRWRRARQMTERVLTEDALKHIHDCQMHGHRPTVQSLAGALHITVDQASDILTDMETRELLSVEGGSLRLTPSGRDYALHILRAHRLWERYLADETGFIETEWHERAERREHTLTRAEADALSAKLGYPTHDSHGDPIPTASGEVVSHGGKPLTAIGIDEPARIVHIEDEPQAIYAQLVAEGLHVGMTVRALEISPQRIRFWANGDEHLLAPIVAANVSVQPLPDEQIEEAEPGERLADLLVGEKGKVLSISRASRSVERRRLLDLGIVPGTIVEAEMTSPSGDPTAYRIRGALVALREEQARLISIARSEEVTI